MPTESPRDTADGEVAAVRRRVAAANRELATVVEQTTQIRAECPERGLRDTHAAMLEAYSAVVRALDELERTLDADGGVETPRRVVDEHADRIRERYPSPAREVAQVFLEHNRRKWLQHQSETNGADAVRRHGLTENQRTWLDTITNVN